MSIFKLSIWGIVLTFVHMSSDIFMWYIQQQTQVTSSKLLHLSKSACLPWESFFCHTFHTYTAIMPTDYALPYSSYFAHIKHPLKWILTYSNSCKPSQETAPFRPLVDRGDPIRNMSTPITRTNFKQQLQRQQLEQQEQLFQAQKQSLTDLPQSQGIAVPRTASPTTVPLDVPSSVLQVWRIIFAIYFFNAVLLHVSSLDLKELFWGWIMWWLLSRTCL